MVKNIILIVSAIFAIKTVSAQYYYKDIVATNDVIKNNQQLRKHNIIKLKVQSYHYDDQEIESFLCEQNIENNAKNVLTITGSPYTGENRLHSFYTTQGLITRSVDSNVSVVVQNYYEYNLQQKLIKLAVSSFEPELKNVRTTETHLWYYDAQQVPNKMVKVINDKDTTTTIFTKDSINNLVLDEVSYKKGKEIERYYYYYDSVNQLTDVVRYHPYKRKLYPEFIFDYNQKGEMIRKTSFQSGTTQATYWYYFYNEKGLKSEEQAFLPGNVFKGKLKYNYTYE
jgi:hypothetical protein